MRTLLVTVLSNNEKSLDNFLKLFRCNSKKNQMGLIKIGRFLGTKKIVTVLKSPHVNKTAQEQFEKKGFVIKILLITNNCNKTIIELKKISHILFSDVQSKIKYLSSSFLNESLEISVLKSNNFKLNYYDKTNTNVSVLSKQKIRKFYLKKKFFKIKNYINILNKYGKMFSYKINV